MPAGWLSLSPNQEKPFEPNQMRRIPGKLLTKMEGFLKSVGQTVDQAPLKIKEGLTDESANPSYY